MAPYFDGQPQLGALVAGKSNLALVGATALVETRGRDFTPTPKLVRITPKLAEQLLNSNHLNRPLRSGRVEQYAEDMRKGRWKMNGETMKFTIDGDILDGQHRLFAIIEADTPIDMLVVEGLDPDVMPTIDTGAPRTLGDVLAINGGKNVIITASVLRWLWWYPKRKSYSSGPSHIRITNQVLFDTLPKNDDVAERVSEVMSTRNARKLMPASILAFVYTMARRVDNAAGTAWFALLETPLGIDEGKHPVLQLRDRLQDNRAAKAKLQALELCALAIKSYNQFATGKRTATLTWRRTEDFPTFAKREKGE
jgi:hypothetical protein